MKFSILYTALISLLLAHGSAVAATSPYSSSSTSTSTTTKSPTKPATTKTTRPTKPAVKPPPAPPPPPPEEPFFSNLSYGIAFISQSVDVTNTSGALSSTNNETGSGIGIYADKFYKGKYRFNGTVSYISYDNFSITSFTAAADYLMPINSSLALFGGVAAGVAGQKYTDSSFSDMSMAPVYGAQLGGIMFMSDSLMLELGYRIRLTNLETEITTIPASIDTIDQLDEAYLSLILSF